MTSLKRQGRKYTGLCPFHKEKSPSFQVDPQLALYHCFGCGAGGDAIDLYMRHSGDDFPQAIENLARRYGIPLPAPEEAPRGDAGPDAAAAFEEAQAFFQRQLERTDFPRQYLDGRQISPELRKRYGLGYAPDGWTALLDTLRPRLGVEVLLAAGLVGRAERGPDLRPLPPSPDVPDLLAVRPHRRFRRPHPGRRPRQIRQQRRDRFLQERRAALRPAPGQAQESANSAAPYWSKVISTCWRSPPAASKARWPAWAPRFTADQARQLARYADEVVMAYDGDDAGRTAAERTLPILLGAGLTVRMALFPDGEDPDSVRVGPGQGGGGPGDRRRGRRHLVRYREERIPPGVVREPRLQSQGVKAVLELLRPLRDRIVRDAYARRAAQRLGVDESVLAAAGRR